MGVPAPLRFVGRVLIDLTVFFLIIVILPGLPPNTEFNSVSLTPPMKLEGKLSKNSLLSEADALLEGKVTGPESIALRGDEIFTGVIGGDVVKVKKDGTVETVAKFGQECGGKWDESRCGRPLGMRFDTDGKLVVVDAYYGLFRVDVDSGKVETLVSSNQTIDGKRPMLLNDLDVAKTGEIYFSDSSTKFSLQDSLFEFLGDGSGRLLKYDPTKKEVTVLMDGLNFANGVQLSTLEGSVLVCETSRFRVWKYYLRGPKMGQKEIFIDGLPGSPDNIRSNRKGGFFISLIAPRYSDKFSLPDALSSLPLIRKFIARIMAMVLSSLNMIDTLMPNIITQNAKYYVGHLEPVASIIPKHGLIIEVDGKGEVIGSLQDPSGKVAHISEISLDPTGNIAFLGSPYNKRIWALRMGQVQGDGISVTIG